MGLLNIAKEFVSNLVHSKTEDWWVEVTTAEPPCVYYFGPFEHVNEAEVAQPGYLEDLRGEGAQGIVTTIKRCSPTAITIAEE